MFFSKKQRYVSLDERDEEVKVGMVPAIRLVAVETGLRWVLTVVGLLCLSILSIWASIYQNWKLNTSSSAVLAPIASGSWSPISAPVSSCISPPIRREWRTLNTAAKRDYIEAVQCLATRPSQVGSNGSLHDDFPWIHQKTAPTAHKAASFFPWHRYFIHIYEQTLQNECGYKDILPYWDWSADWKDFANAPVWDSKSGFGGNGDASTQITVGEGRCVTDGPFAGLKALYYGEEYQPHCLSRGFQTGTQLEELASLVRPDVVESIMQTDDFGIFSSALEKNAHHFMSGSVRGDFSRYTGPYDPVFFLHHVNLDRLWWQWQQENPDRRLFAYNGLAPKTAFAKVVQLTDKLDIGALDSIISVKDVMETNKGLFCYQY